MSTNLTVERASVANDIFKSQHSNLNSMQLISAFDRQFQANDSKLIVLIYGDKQEGKNGNGKLYEGIMLADI
jgi:hypothetical protein